MIRHVAMFKWKDGITEKEKSAVFRAWEEMQERVPSVSAFTGGPNIERTRHWSPDGWVDGPNTNNWDLVIVSDFADITALEAYFEHPFMNEVSDLVASATQPEITARVQFEL